MRFRTTLLATPSQPPQADLILERSVGLAPNSAVNWGICRPMEPARSNECPPHGGPACGTPEPDEDWASLARSWSLSPIVGMCRAEWTVVGEVFSVGRSGFPSQ